MADMFVILLIFGLRYQGIKFQKYLIW